MNTMEEFEKEQLDERLVRRIQLKVFAMERENHKIKKFTDGEMVQRIRKAIDEVVREGLK